MKFVDEMFEINENSYSEFDLFSIKTYLYEIEEIEKYDIFKTNVEKINNHFQTLNKRMAKDNNISYKKIKEIKKQSRKILKRIK